MPLLVTVAALLFKWSGCPHLEGDRSTSYFKGKLNNNNNTCNSSFYSEIYIFGSCPSLVCVALGNKVCRFLLKKCKLFTVCIEQMRSPSLLPAG